MKDDLYWAMEVEKLYFKGLHYYAAYRIVIERRNLNGKGAT